MKSPLVEPALRILAVACLLIVAASFGKSVEAGIFVFNTSDSQFTPGVNNQGWWSHRPNKDLNDDYSVGSTGDAEHRSFFTFDLTALAGSVLSASLELTPFGYNSSDPSETLELFDVSTPADKLNNNSGTATSIFNDLGSGESYGSFVVNAHPPSDTLTFTFNLNANALADIQSSAGGFFSVGGALTTLGPNAEMLFQGSSAGGIQRLIVTTADAPEPAVVPEASTLVTWSILAVACGSAGWLRRRRKGLPR
jgi:hypothetical protein